LIKSNFSAHKTTDDEIIVLKPLRLLQSYQAVFDRAQTKNFLEVGLFEGGSTIFFALTHPQFRISALDIRKPDEAVLRHVHNLGLNDRVKIHYETSQSDKGAIEKIIRDDFGGEKLGLVCDDASHDYALSRRTFEIRFARLAAGGCYCLEDWAWAHWNGCTRTSPALSNLAFEMMILLPSTHDLVQSVEVTGDVVRVIRGTRPVNEEISLDRLLSLRGKKLSLI
jgi:hypothetical protein